MPTSNLKPVNLCAAGEARSISRAQAEEFRSLPLRSDELRAARAAALGAIIEAGATDVVITLGDRTVTDDPGVLALLAGKWLSARVDAAGAVYSVVRRRDDLIIELPIDEADVNAEIARLGTLTHDLWRSASLVVSGNHPARVLPLLRQRLPIARRD